jgi:hypothetical protein
MKVCIAGYPEETWHDGNRSTSKFYMYSMEGPIKRIREVGDHLITLAHSDSSPGQDGAPLMIYYGD